MKTPMGGFDYGNFNCARTSYSYQALHLGIFAPESGLVRVRLQLILLIFSSMRSLSACEALLAHLRTTRLPISGGALPVFEGESLDLGWGRVFGGRDVSCVTYCITLRSRYVPNVALCPRLADTLAPPSPFLVWYDLLAVPIVRWVGAAWGSASSTVSARPGERVCCKSESESDRERERGEGARGVCCLLHPFNTPLRRWRPRRSGIGIAGSFSSIVQRDVIQTMPPALRSPRCPRAPHAGQLVGQAMDAASQTLDGMARTTAHGGVEAGTQARTVADTYAAASVSTQFLRPGNVQSPVESVPCGPMNQTS